MKKQVGNVIAPVQFWFVLYVFIQDGEQDKRLVDSMANVVMAPGGMGSGEAPGWALLTM